MDVCPLIFQPIFKPKVWGAQNLARLLGKNPPQDEPIGESWECADLDNGQSVVARGPAAGQTLHKLVEAWGPELLGRAELTDGRFPLLIKFLDAAQDLSVQVHPDPATAKRLGGDVRVKHEAWYIIHAEPGALIYRGFKPGAKVEELARLMPDDPEVILNFLVKIPVKPGEMYYLPSGTLHALGEGVVVAEVQTPSDITYRLYDWGRVRPANDAGLHIEQGLACIRTDLDFAQHEKRSHVSSMFSSATRLVTCPSFIVEKVWFTEGFEQDIPYGEMACWIVLGGNGEIQYGDGGNETFSKGDVVILPAQLDKPRVKLLSDTTWLEVTIPIASDLAAYDRVGAATLRGTETDGAKLMQINIDRSAR